MRAPYGMNILDNCLNCPAREERLFCALGMPALQVLNEMKSTAIYPEHALLFTEGQKARGAFILCSGRAKLSASSNGGRTIIVKISEPGDVLGLSASIANHPYEVTAEMIEPGQANFISREALLQFLRGNSEVAMRVGQVLSLNYYSAHEEIRTLGITRSPEERLAKLLLSWFTAKENGRGSQIKLTFTHSEIGEMIGATRETVTRLFTDLRRRQIVQRMGATLMLRNKPALAQMVH
jgi:CRP/FNR family transcriptional regulator, cyclic AMP receptor protein